MAAFDSQVCWLRRFLVGLSLLGVLTILFPWMSTEVKLEGGASEVSYSNGIPSQAYAETRVVGWHGLLASTIFLVFGLGLLAVSRNRGRTIAVCGMAAGMLTMVIAASFFMAGDPLQDFRLLGPIKVNNVPAQIRFTKSVGPLAARARPRAKTAYGGDNLVERHDNGRSWLYQQFRRFYCH